MTQECSESLSGRHHNLRITTVRVQPDGRETVYAPFRWRSLLVPALVAFDIAAVIAFFALVTK